MSLESSGMILLYMQPKFRINRITGLAIPRSGPKLYTRAHAHTHTRTRAHEHTHTRTHARTHMCACSCACACACACARYMLYLTNIILELQARNSRYPGQVPTHDRIFLLYLSLLTSGQKSVPYYVLIEAMHS